MKFFFMHIDIVSDSSSTLSPLKINYEMIDKFFYAIKKKIAIEKFRITFLCFQ